LIGVLCSNHSKGTRRYLKTACVRLIFFSNSAIPCMSLEVTRQYGEHGVWVGKVVLAAFNDGREAIHDGCRVL
jgi:hypothetical protein